MLLRFWDPRSSRCRQWLGSLESQLKPLKTSLHAFILMDLTMLLMILAPWNRSMARRAGSVSFHTKSFLLHNVIRWEAHLFSFLQTIGHTHEKYMFINKGITPPSWETTLAGWTCLWCYFCLFFKGHWHVKLMRKMIILAQRTDSPGDVQVDLQAAEPTQPTKIGSYKNASSCALLSF